MSIMRSLVPLEARFGLLKGLHRGERSIANMADCEDKALPFTSRKMECLWSLPMLLRLQGRCLEIVDFVCLVQVGRGAL